MQTEQEKIAQLEHILLDKEEDDYAELVSNLTVDQIDKLHNMMMVLKSQNEMRTRIVAKIKHDITGFVNRPEGFASYCELEEFSN